MGVFYSTDSSLKNKDFSILFFAFYSFIACYLLPIIENFCKNKFKYVVVSFHYQMKYLNLFFQKKARL